MLQPVFSIKEMCSNFLAVEKEQSWHQAWLMRANPLPLPPPASLKSDHILSHFLTRQKCHHGREDLAPFFILRENGENCVPCSVYTGIDTHQFIPAYQLIKQINGNLSWNWLKPSQSVLWAQASRTTRVHVTKFRQRPSLPFPWLFCSEVTAAQLFKWTAAFLSLAMVHGTMVYEYN